MLKSRPTLRRKPNGFGYIYAKECSLTLCSIFSNSGHVFRMIKNPNSQFEQDTLRKQSYQLSLQQQKTLKKGNNTMEQHIFMII